MLKKSACGVLQKREASFVKGEAFVISLDLTASRFTGNCLASSLAAALLDGLFEHPAGSPSFLRGLRGVNQEATTDPPFQTDVAFIDIHEMAPYDFQPTFSGGMGIFYEFDAMAITRS